ncbi:UbiA family prenyltransferase [Ferruginibacter sp. HRS2-29]|uniref:UbiA family prenyltransferase n=1 Tax=Ferruginibacter sp. HRS2-29 TaxID=2487334 RepID=UPI0020CB822E|nr:UbiA family prenyltransferase [Ferruginibacter sp. HRS2-29]
MLRSSTIQLLRFHFSLFLMPVYWFALSQVLEVNWGRALLVFIILHLLVYPSSNGYNSYMDRDTESIGGIKNPKAPTRQLFYASVTMDIVAILLSFFISLYFVVGIFLYIAASRAYSYRGIRLKKYPVTGYLTVIFFQGAITYFLVKHGCSSALQLSVSPVAMAASSLLVGGFYPLTQIYQHRQDKEDGVRTLSILLGYRGTFVFTAIIYFIAMLMLGIYFAENLELDNFIIFQTFMLPVLVYFFWWFYKVHKSVDNANFTNTMRMNLLASVCTNAAFITILIADKF